MTADIHDDKSKKRDWDGIIALAILVTTPITFKPTRRAAST